MKFLVAFLCFAATVAAEPEADAQVALAYGYPAYAYNNYGYGYGYPTFVYGPTGSSYQRVSTPVSDIAIHQLHKRDAEPSVLPYVASPYAYGYSPYTYAYVPAASSYQQVNTPVSSYGIHQLHKREAEPQGVAVHPGYGLSSTFRSPQGAPALYGYPSVYGYGYGYPTYGAYGAHFLGKREAEAEPQGIAAHPGYGLSSTYRSTQGAPALYPYAPYYGVYGYNGIYGYNGYF